MEVRYILKQLNRFFRKDIYKIYLKTLPIYVFSYGLILLAVYFAPPGDYWQPLIIFLGFLTLLFDQIAKKLTIVTLYNEEVVSDYKYSVVNTSIFSISSIIDFIILSVFHSIKVFLYIILPLGVILDIYTYNTVFPSVLYDKIYITSLLDAKTAVTYSYTGESSFKNYIKQNKLLIILKIIMNFCILFIFTFIFGIVFKDFAGDFVQYIPGRAVYNFVNITAVIFGVACILYPYINYKNTLWNIYIFDQKLVYNIINAYYVNDYYDAYQDYDGYQDYSENYYDDNNYYDENNYYNDDGYYNENDTYYDN